MSGNERALTHTNSIWEKVPLEKISHNGMSSLLKHPSLSYIFTKPPTVEVVTNDCIETKVFLLVSKRSPTKDPIGSFVRLTFQYFSRVVLCNALLNRTNCTIDFLYHILRPSFVSMGVGCVIFEFSQVRNETVPIKVTARDWNKEILGFFGFLSQDGSRTLIQNRAKSGVSL